MYLHCRQTVFSPWNMQESTLGMFPVTCTATACDHESCPRKKSESENPHPSSPVALPVFPPTYTIRCVRLARTSASRRSGAVIALFRF